jgi:aquaporin Z
VTGRPGAGAPRGPVYREPNDDETPWIRDAHDPSHELRRLFAEALGTFFLVLVSVGAVVVDAKSHGDVSLAVQAVVPGLAIMAIIYAIGNVSGAHVNPAVTFAYALRKNFPWRRVPGYWLAQLVGAVAAVGFLRLSLGNVGQLGESAPGPHISGLTAFCFELVLTLGLATVTLGTASGQNNVGPNAAIARGGYVAAAGLWAISVSGASMNPMRSLGAALVGNHWSHLWIYVLGPLAGAAIAVGFAWILRGPPTLAADEAAQGHSSEAMKSSDATNEP